MILGLRLCRLPLGFASSSLLSVDIRGLGGWKRERRLGPSYLSNMTSAILQPGSGSFPSSRTWLQFVVFPYSESSLILLLRDTPFSQPWVPLRCLIPSLHGSSSKLLKCSNPNLLLQFTWLQVHVIEFLVSLFNKYKQHLVVATKISWNFKIYSNQEVYRIRV